MAITESRERRRRFTHSVMIAMGCWTLIAALHLAGAFSIFDLRLLDARFRLRGERAASDQIAIVGVDDATIRGYGSWPLPRDAYALLITAIEEGGAGAIGLDLQFPRDANQDPRSDLLLAQVIENHPNVTPAVWFEADESAPSDPEPRARETIDAFARHGRKIDGHGAAVAASVSLPIDEIVTGAASLGHISVAVDPDGALRRIPLVVRYRDRVYPALTLCMAGFAPGRSGIQSLAEGGLKISGMRGLESALPVDKAGSTSIDFAGDQSAFHHTYSMLEVLQWYGDGDLARIRDAFSDRLVLVGLTSRQEAAVDLGTTPFATATPLVYLHANALDNLLRGRFLTRMSGVTFLALLAALAALLGGWLAAVPITTAAILSVAVTLLLAALDFAVFAWWAVDVPPVATLAMPLVVYAATQSYRHLFLEQRSRQRELDIRAGLTVQQEFLPEALVGKSLSHYIIVEKVGQGGMGVVYRATDQRLHRDVAVKVLPGGLLADESARRRFRRQALMLSKLNHPGLAGVHDFDTQDGVDFMVMEFVHGISLEERLRKGRISETEAIRIAMDITEALAEVHAHNIIHRDIKPANVMITPKGAAKLLDFGVARMAFTSEASPTLTDLTREGEMVGTLAYMAPEQLCHKPVGPAADVYAIGTLLFEMTTGRRPFSDDVPWELIWTIVNQDPPRPRVLNARLTPAMEQIILCALRKVPEERYESVSALLAALRGLDHEDVAVAPVS